MAQSDQTIQNAAFPTVRADINDNLAAIYSQNSGASAPSTTVAFQPWVDTSSSPPVWKIRNAANSAWITVGVLDPTNFQVGGVSPIANGGTGQTTAAAAIAALLPSQTGNADKALVTDGAALLWSVITSSSFTKYTFAAGSGTGSTRTHTWTKPSSGSTAIVFVWGGGGGGGRDSSTGSGGGAGSNCGFGFFPLSELGATETITIGLGGAGRSGNGNGNDGTNSTFGSLLTSYGGNGGVEDTTDEYSQGSTPFGTGQRSTSASRDLFAGSILAGGYGAKPKADNAGGDAVFGGGGGGGCNTSSSGGVGGTSIIAGNGGQGQGDQNGDDGAIPGGGGGAAEDHTSGSGGNGECWVLIF